MSWGGGEFVEETLLSMRFSPTPGVVYLASSGMGPGVIVASFLFVPRAVQTHLVVDADRVVFCLKNSWQDTGGGPSPGGAGPASSKYTCSLLGTLCG